MTSHENEAKSKETRSEKNRRISISSSKQLEHAHPLAPVHMYFDTCMQSPLSSLLPGRFGSSHVHVLGEEGELGSQVGKEAVLVVEGQELLEKHRTWRLVAVLQGAHDGVQGLHAFQQIGQLGDFALVDLRKEKKKK